MSRLLPVLGATIALLSTGCGGSKREPYAPLGEVVVSAAAPNMPPGCEPAEVAGLLTHFADAVSTGDRARLQELFGRQVSPFVATDGVDLGPHSDEVIAFLLERQRLGERWTLCAVEARRLVVRSTGEPAGTADRIPGLRWEHPLDA